MNRKTSVLIDNTTVDSAIRMLSSEERRRRREIGWCLRDLSDLSCLASLLDALVYFDNLFVIPPNRFPTTEHIASSGTSGFWLRRHINFLDLPSNEWENLAADTRARVAELLNDKVLSKRIAMPPLGRGVYKFEASQKSGLDIYPDESGISPRDTELAFQRAVLYLSAADRWRKHNLGLDISVWLSPERFLLAQLYSPLQARSEMETHQAFNEALGGYFPQLVSIAPSLFLLLALAGERRREDFSEFFLDQINILRSELNLGEVRMFFNQSLTTPISPKEIEEWTSYKDEREKFLDFLDLFPGPVKYIQLLLKWGQEPALKKVGSLLSWKSDERAIVRSVANECRQLSVNKVVQYVIEAFSGYNNDENLHHRYRLETCIEAFKMFLHDAHKPNDPDITIIKLI